MRSPLTQIDSDDKTDRNIPVAHISTNVPVRKKDRLSQIDKQLTMAEIVKNGEWKKNIQDNNWTLVQRNKSKKRFAGMMGKAASNSTGNFRAAEIKIPLFISHVNK
ncbi:unnamed protein product [Arctia plantaginis]|uniref:Uncharacterized protein n=1 Tax=Arctia plantaginis TaxID=874455 RepID=A0A8S1ACD5_ARCPL|nr:unnamed protein product [Arctia plantaginis]